MARTKREAIEWSFDDSHYSVLVVLFHEFGSIPFLGPSNPELVYQFIRNPFPGIKIE